ncbi:hypothetical protein [Mycobacterium sp.]|uniref:hypothetical protein n=1 Tax=Mycobacterium sp. TaxID=1785 RepID=UPI00260050E2|nr:hypothetical protein [Mycobacterium sp.]MBW0013418.1 hypothetical protein [Mycobacterium sp.]
MEAVLLAGKSIDGSCVEGRWRWRDQATGCLITASSPEVEPELWDRYLDGALRSYRRHGLEWVLDIDAVRDGADTALFFAAVDPAGRVIGGTRVVGPLRSPEDSHALEEWNGSPGRTELRRMIANRLPFGVVEVKSAWTDSRDYGGRALSRVLARTALPMMTLLDVQFVMATAAAHVLEQWRSSGGVVAARIPAAAYPDENYRTKVMWWDRRTIATHAEPEQFKLMCAENSEIIGRISA